MGEPSVGNFSVGLGFLLFLCVSDQGSVSGSVFYVTVKSLISGGSLLLGIRILLTRDMGLGLAPVKRVRYNCLSSAARFEDLKLRDL